VNGAPIGSAISCRYRANDVVVVADTASPDRAASR
jgi:hypothetical protein